MKKNKALQASPRQNNESAPAFCSLAVLLMIVAALSGLLPSSNGAAAASGTLEVIDSAAPPWPAIGRVNVAGYRSTSMCTGTLIAPDLVLTAAHCLFNKLTSRPFQEKDVLFLAGVRRDEYAARLETECFVMPEKFRFRKSPVLADVVSDVALLVLKAPARIAPLPPLTDVGANDLTKSNRFQSVGYRRSRRFLPTLVPSCSFIGRAAEAWVTDCPTEQGASGGPVLVETANGLRVAGITSGKIDDRRSVVVPFSAWQDLLKSASCTEGNRPSLPALRPAME